MELFDTPRQIIERITEKDNPLDGEIYLIKIKCICCMESEFLSYKEPLIEGELLHIGNVSFPLKLIEKVVCRERTKWGSKRECTYKVYSSYLKQFLSDEAREQLAELKLL